MKAKQSFTISTNIFEGEKAINSICVLGSELDGRQKELLHEIDKFVQNIWQQMTYQQFPNGINSKTKVTI